MISDRFREVVSVGNTEAWEIDYCALFTDQNLQQALFPV